MAFEDLSGTVRKTADSVIGISGKPCRVFTVSHTSGAGGAGNLVLRNGTTASGTVYVNQAGSGANAVDLFGADKFGANGLEFPDGCFFDKDANTSAVVIEFRSEA